MSPRDDLTTIYSAAIRAVDPFEAVTNSLSLKGDVLTLRQGEEILAEENLSIYERVLVVGAGKATAPMALAVEDILEDRISRGAVSVKYGYIAELKKIAIHEAAHPVPDAAGAEAAGEIVHILEDAGEKDLVISLISGGGSALLPLPPSSISLEEKQKTTDLLLKSGASIHEINAVRKHLSQVKGGNLARAAHPARVLNLMISDVVGDAMDVIASGPFVADSSTFIEAAGILEKYHLTKDVPSSVTAYIQRGVEKEVEENPSEGSVEFDRVTNAIIASNIIALEAAADAAEELGYNTCILSSLIEGDTAEAAFWHSRIADEVRATGNPVEAPGCIISGGETTVIVTGNGLGGRNMEFALQAAPYIRGKEGILMASIGTDGSDGPTDAAGAVADGTTVSRGEDLGVFIDDYIRSNDSYHYFQQLDDLIITGPTNTNVMDVRIVIVDR